MREGPFSASSWRCCSRRDFWSSWVRWCVSGGRWAAASFNRHLYNSAGQLASGSVLDRDGDVLSWAENGERRCYDGETVRKATLHTVGDLQGSVATGVLRTYADALTGYSLLNGAYGAEQGRALSLTIDAYYNYVAYQALNGRKGAVAVYNYQTGEILCMVSAPSYDPLMCRRTSRPTSATRERT